MDPRDSSIGVLLGSPLAVVVSDRAGCILVWNAAAERLFGWMAADLIGRAAPFVPDARKSEEESWRAAALGGASFANAPTLRLRRDGRDVLVVASCSPWRGPDGTVAGVAMMFSETVNVTESRETTSSSRVVLDSTERRELEARIERAERTDLLTGLANRATFRRRSGEALDSARSNGSFVAVLLADFDRFKTVNDSLGHDAGDAVLAQAAERLRGLVDDESTAARLGQDRFGIFLAGAREADAIALGREVLEALAVPFSIGHESLTLTASVGGALGPRDGGSADDVLRSAERALLRAKEQGVGMALFDASTDGKDSERLWIETELRRALDRGKLEVQYQPIRRLSDGVLVGAEALARWTHPERGPIPPGRFIPIAEESGLIAAVDRWIMASAVRQLARWRKSGLDIWVTSNVSPRSLHDPDLPTRLKATMAEFGADAAGLVVEITERVLAEPGHALGVLQRLREAGARIAIDDFGTGYSSLAYLQEFPFDILKVDAQFVRGIGAQQSKAEAIARTVISLAHNLGIPALAEGIEEEEQSRWLRAAGCDMGQGFHLGMPGAAEKIGIV